jgi:hypothetical protein
MEFEGRIKNVMPAKTGVSQRGNEWKSLPFVFEYKEVETDPYPDSVMLETFDAKIIAGIEACCQKDKDGNLVVNSGEYILMRDIFVKISFRHKAKIYIPKDGGQPRFINDIRMNDIKAVRPANQPAPQQQPGNVLGGPQTPPYNPQTQFPPQVDAQGNPITNQGGNYDDLPF